MNTFEVEIKFRVREGSIAELERQLQQRFGGGSFDEPVTESDSFFQHPCRDFVQTDECLRLRHRHFADGSSDYSLTYKGPKIDAKTKTRQELEMPMTEPEVCESLLVALGFRKVASVRKLRRRMDLTFEQRRVTIVFDTLPDLPESTRQFVELETIAAKEDLDECRSLLFRIAEQLDLSEPIRDSYLKLVHG
jgi:adenylate cyclase class 2